MSPRAYIQLFSEFFPVLAFFVAGQLTAFSVAAVVLLVTTLISLFVSLIILRSVPIMPLFSGVVVILFGGLTIIYNEPGFLIFADTFYYFSLAALVFIGFFRNRHFLEYMFDHTFAMQKTGWYILSVRWFLVLCVAGIANECARYWLEPEDWIDYRFLKILLLVAFSFYQFTLSKKYRIPEKSNRLGLRIRD